jgi:hypothetical protein
MKYKYTAQAVKWFEKVNGNTYHSVRITDNETGAILYCPFSYGYGEAYRWTALIAMSKNKWLPEKYQNDAKYYLYERENDYPINWIVSDGLKRDCMANGKE